MRPTCVYARPFSATRQNEYKRQMNYLSQAKTLSDNNSIKEQIIEFENKARIRLPPVFRAFVENYDIFSLELSMFNKIYFPDKNNSSYFELTKFTPNPEVVFESLLSPSNYIKAMNNVYHYEEDEEIIKDKILIGNIHGGTLLLGYEGINSDKIYADFIGEGERLIKVGDDIFSYFKSIEIKPNENILRDFNLELNNLFKKWGEDFWRFEQKKVQEK